MSKNIIIIQKNQAKFRHHIYLEKRDQKGQRCLHGTEEICLQSWGWGRKWRRGKKRGFLTGKEFSKIKNLEVTYAAAVTNRFDVAWSFLMCIFIAYVQLKMVYVTNNEFWLWARETINDPPHCRNALWGLFITTFTPSQSSLFQTDSMSPSSVVCARFKLLALKKAKGQNLLRFLRIWHIICR